MFLRPRPDNKIAFGAELSSCTYRLTLARYASIAEFFQREIAASGKDLKLLDIACGEGRLILYGPFPGISFHGIDVRRTSLIQARERGYTDVVEGNVIHGLPFPDHSFGIIVCSHILEHLEYPDHFVSEIERVLRPGGLLVVGGDSLGPVSLNDLFEGEPDLGLGEPLTHAEPVTLIGQAPRHPIMRGLGSLAGALGQTRFRRTRPIAVGTGQVLARFGDGRPALVEHAAGAGRVLVLGTDLGIGWSDFPRRVAFVPFLHETLGYLTSGVPRPREFLVGDQPADLADQPGAVMSADGLRRLVINVDPRESDPTVVNAEAFVASVGTLSTTDGRETPDVARAPESGPRLWRVFLMLMVLVLVAEGLLSRRMV